MKKIEHQESLFKKKTPDNLSDPLPEKLSLPELPPWHIDKTVFMACQTSGCQRTDPDIGGLVWFNRITNSYHCLNCRRENP